MKEELLSDFIDWAEMNAPDAWWIFENKDDAIEQFLIWYNQDIE